MASLIRDNCLVGCRFEASPNFNDRPEGCGVELLVIHNISLPPGAFGGPAVLDFFANRLDPEAHPFFAEIAPLRVSTHLFIRRDGQTLQLVPFDKRAWHAGRSAYQGRSECNDFSVGIELEGTDTIPYTDAQYRALAEAAAALIEHYPNLDAERITGHCDIAPERKSDPGPAFDWALFRRELAARLAAGASVASGGFGAF